MADDRKLAYAEALFNVMPLNAMAATPPDRVLPAAEIGPALARLAYELADLSDEEFEARSEAAMTSSPELDPIENEAAVVAQDNTVDIRAVKVGERSGNLWIIDQGLKAGERVVVEGLQKLKAGMTVKSKPFHGSPEGQAR